MSELGFLHSVSGGHPVPTHLDLARLLAAFHALPDCPCHQAGFEPIKTPESRLATAAEIGPEDNDFLRNRCVELKEQFEELAFALPVGPIHGDAHTRNLLTDRGQVVLLEFESSAYGPREWDRLPTAIAVEAVWAG